MTPTAASPTVSKTPDFPAAGGHVERKPIRVAHHVVFRLAERSYLRAP